MAGGTGHLRKFAPAARGYATARLEAGTGVRVDEVRMLDLDDVRWELDRFGKVNVRHGKGSRQRGPKPQLVLLINGADRGLRWFIEDVWGQFDDGHDRPGAPLSLPSATARTARARGRRRTCSAGHWPGPPAAACPSGRAS